MAVVIIYYTSLIAAILIHELGHLFAVWFAGYKFVAFSIGPLSVVSRNNQLQFKPRMGLFSGSVKFQRTVYAASLRNDLIVFSAGIVANILVGALLIWLYFATLKHFEFSPFIIVGVVSLLIGIANLIPKHYKSLGLDSDAMQLIKLYRHWKSQNIREA